MDYVTLSNGDPMPMVGLGVFQITDAKQCEKAVLDALDAGYRHIDTAQVYGNEEAVGNAIAASGIDRRKFSSRLRSGYQTRVTRTPSGP